MRFIKRLAITCFSLVLSSCTPNQHPTFYLLKAMPSTLAKTAQDDSSFVGVKVLVEPAKFPEYLDRPQMILRENEYKLQITEQHRWAEPIKNDFTRVFVENLDSRIAPGDASVYAELDGSTPNYQLSIEVFQMDVNMDDQVILRAEWSLYTGNKTKLLKRKNSEYSLAIDNKSYESGVEVQSKAIALLADQVAETLRMLHEQSTYEF